MRSRLLVPVIAALALTPGLAGAAEGPVAAPGTEGTPKMSSNARSSAQVAAGGSARASSSSTASSSSAGGCSAETTASVTRDGKTITVHRSQHSDTAGCNAESHARTPRTE